MSKALEIYHEAFSLPRDARSDEYKHGVLDTLKLRLREITEVNVLQRYGEGTAQVDAYLAGCKEGHSLARAYMQKITDSVTNRR